MLRRSLASLPSWRSRVLPRFPQSQSLRFLSTISSSEQIGADANKKRSLFRRRAIPVVLLSITGGVTLSALNDLAIFHGCSSKAIEKASQNQKIVEALGEPIVRGPWYDATLAVGFRRNTVSCTFPVSGPQGSGIFQLKAVRTGEDSLFAFLRHHDWDILVMEALLHVPTEDDKQQTFQFVGNELQQKAMEMAVSVQFSHFAIESERSSSKAKRHYAYTAYRLLVLALIECVHSFSEIGSFSPKDASLLPVALYRAKLVSYGRVS